MIKAITMYVVYCDMCGKLFDDGKPPMRNNECHLYTGVGRALIGIQVFGWVVMHNQPNHKPRIVCPRCNKEAENFMQDDN